MISLNVMDKYRHSFVLVMGLLFLVVSSCGDLDDKQSPNEDIEENSKYKLVASGEYGEYLSVPESYKGCQEHDDCTRVAPTCDSCCQFDAINKEMEPVWDKNRSKACSGYHGPVCDCIFPDVLPRCVDSLCRAVNRGNIRTCFSPGQNMEFINDPDAVGCACDTLDLRICVDDIWLVCEEGEIVDDNWEWVVAEEANCLAGQGDEECEMGTVLDDIEKCIKQGLDCFQLVDGRFCSIVSQD